MDKVKTGQMIKEARLKQGYTQLELGNLLGVTNKAVSRWEKGESFPDVGVLETLSDILHLDIQDIVAGEHLTDKDKACPPQQTSLESEKHPKNQKYQRCQQYLRPAGGVLLAGYLSGLGCYMKSYRFSTVSSQPVFILCSLAAVLVLLLLWQRAKIKFNADRIIGIQEKSCNTKKYC